MGPTVLLVAMLLLSGAFFAHALRRYRYGKISNDDEDDDGDDDDDDDEKGEEHEEGDAASDGGMALSLEGLLGSDPFSGGGMGGERNLVAETVKLDGGERKSMSERMRDLGMEEDEKLDGGEDDDDDDDDDLLAMMDSAK